MKTLHGYEILDIAYTRGDHSTQPGGIVLAHAPNKFGEGQDEWIAWSFNRDKGSKIPREYFWGRYCRSYKDGRAAFNQKLGMSRQYDTGGSLMEPYQVDREIAAELGRKVA